MDEPQGALMVADTARRQELHKMLADYLITVSDQMFQKRDVYVDGYRFINCSFLHCRLFILRGTFELHHCLMIEGSRIFSEDSMKSIQLYTLGFPNLQYSTIFAAKQNADGTVSIGKGASIA